MGSRASGFVPPPALKNESSWSKSALAILVYCISIASGEGLEKFGWLLEKLGVARTRRVLRTKLPSPRTLQRQGGRTGRGAPAQFSCISYTARACT